jgi:putative membrane protein
MVAAGAVLAGLAALVHVYIFTMESLTWTSERTQAVFGLDPDQALATREMAFNQGFYNLFLAVAVVLGFVLRLSGHHDAGNALVYVGLASMAAAALVLFLSNPDHRMAAVKQGVIPGLAILALSVGGL